MRYALYKIKRPNVRKIALVKNPANGNRWHMFKSAPGEAELDQFVDSLSHDEAEQLLEKIEAQERRDDQLREHLTQRVEQVEAKIQGRQALAKGSSADLAAALANLASIGEREALRRRAEQDSRQPRDHCMDYLNMERPSSYGPPAPGDAGRV